MQVFDTNEVEDHDPRCHNLLTQIRALKNVRIGVVLVPFLILAVLLVWLVRRSQRLLELDPSRHGALQAAHRTALRWRWVGLGLGIVASALTVNADSLGCGLLLTPTVLGLCVIVGVIVGELTAIPRRQGVRTAALETRAVADYLPRRLTGLVTASTVDLGALLVTTTPMGSADDMGRAGRSLSRQGSPGMWGIFASASPWPGLFYSVPLGIAVAAGLLVAAVALRTVVLRPRGGSAPDLVAADNVLRRRPAEAVAAATGVMVAASVSGVSLIAGARLLSFQCPPTSWTVLGGVLLAVAVLMLLLVGACLALLLVSPRVLPMEPGETAVTGLAVRR